jgi:uncharacterized repeat protein (TIGR03803 family)
MRPLALICSLLFVATAIAASGQTFTSLASFNYYGDGAYPPYGSLIQGLDGNFYGITQAGGSNGGGTVYRMTASGTVTPLYSFCAQINCTDGIRAYAGLVRATDGNFYGTTYNGGANGDGTVFKINPEGELTTLYSFCAQANCADGYYPYAGLIQGNDRNFYGTTFYGGTGQSCHSGCGTVFKISSEGTLTTLHSFDLTDGAVPYAGLVGANDGNLYGTTGEGGSGTACDGGCGTVFKISPEGALTTLHSFDVTDGATPYAGLVQASDRNFYGTTAEGGAGAACSGGCGTVFRITPEGTLTTLYSFNSNDGATPFSGLIQATDGNFYGTTYYGGASGTGTVFRLTPGTTLTTLYSFCAQSNCTDGAYPSAGLVEGTTGILYGTTQNGGNIINYGTVFSLSVGLGPFVETLPTVGKVETHVIILGTGLIGTSSVTFNGTTATFTVVSSTEIKTTVPTGATSGKVQVTTPHGTLSSNVAFTVKP